TCAPPGCRASRKPPRRSSMRRRRPSGSARGRSRSTAATATSRTIRSSATIATPASRRSTKAPARSSGSSSRAHFPGRPLTTPTQPPSPATVWAAQLGGTVAIAIALYLFLANAAPVFGGVDAEWRRYALYLIAGAGAPAIGYLRRYKRILDQDIAVTNSRRGVPEPDLRRELLRRLSIGGALCELPLAFGVISVLAGCEARMLVGGALVSVLLRLSYRPFRR